MMKKVSLFLSVLMLIMLCACSAADGSGPAEPSGAESAAVQYDYPLNAGETAEVYDVTFHEPVTVTVDPASTRDASADQRSNIYFDNCEFLGGLTVVGDYHAMVSLGEGCTFSNGSIVTCREATPGASRETTLEDNLIKVFVACEGVEVEAECAVGVLSDGPDVVLNGTAYSKAELTPDSAFLGVYCIYETDEPTYIKLAIGEDDSAEVLE